VYDIVLQCNYFIKENPTYSLPHPPRERESEGAFQSPSFLNGSIDYEGASPLITPKKQKHKRQKTTEERKTEL